MSCGLVMTVCGCRLHAAKRRLPGCKMFRRLTTTGVATGQLAGSLKPQVAQLVSTFSCLFSQIPRLVSLIFSLLLIHRHCLTLASCLAFMSYLNSPSSPHQRKHTYHKHARLHMYKNTVKCHKLARLPCMSPCPTCPLNYTHTYTLVSLLFLITHGLEEEKEKKIGKKNS